jgi:hypothetical protein
MCAGTMMSGVRDLSLRGEIILNPGHTVNYEVDL